MPIAVVRNRTGFEALSITSPCILTSTGESLQNVISGLEALSFVLMATSQVSPSIFHSSEGKWYAATRSRSTTGGQTATTQRVLGRVQLDSEVLSSTATSTYEESCRDTLPSHGIAIEDESWQCPDHRALRAGKALAGQCCASTTRPRPHPPHPIMQPPAGPLTPKRLPCRPSHALDRLDSPLRLDALYPHPNPGISAASYLPFWLALDHEGSESFLNLGFRSGRLPATVSS
nr:hypothetical protein CFP56_66841 [Quercus suber]